MIKLSDKAIEEWCIELDKRPRNTPMSEEDCETFVRIVFNKDRFDSDSNMTDDMRKLQATGIILNRLPCFDYKMTNSAILVLSLFVKSPGEIVQYLTWIQYRCFKDKKKTVDVNYLSTKLIPFGGFSEKDLSETWDLNKVDGLDGNLLDHYEYMDSIRF